jgi:two-component system nitrate/nitrite response regulator NarL
VNGGAPPASLVLVDGEDLFRSSFVEALEAEPDLHVVAAAATRDAGRAAAHDLTPDLVITAARLEQRLDGFLLCTEIRSKAPAPAVLILLDAQDPAEILLALEGGALGTLSREERLEDALRSIRAALRGEACVPRRMLGGVLGALISRRRETDEVHRRYERLSRREREVLALLAQGHDHTKIASMLVISPQTARTHIQNILEKLEVHSRVEAAGLVIEHGLTTPSGGAS